MVALIPRSRWQPWASSMAAGPGPGCSPRPHAACAPAARSVSLASGTGGSRESSLPEPMAGRRAPLVAVMGVAGDGGGAEVVGAAGREAGPLRNRPAVETELLRHRPAAPER